MSGASIATPLEPICATNKVATALRIFHELPEGHVAFRMPDRSLAPLVQRGEVIVADITDRALCLGGLYLRRFVSRDGRARIHVDELISQSERRISTDQTWYHAEAFYFVKHNRPKCAADWPVWAKENGGVFHMAFGPLCPEHADTWQYYAGTVVGRVAGVLDFGQTREEGTSQC